MQSRLQSAIESCTNVAIGYFVALAAQLAVFPMYGIDVKLADNVQIGIIFTAVSLVRSYVIRRFFNRRTN